MSFLLNSYIVAPSSYDPMTTAYMTAIGVPNDATVYFTGDTFRQKTGTQWWNNVNAFVKNLKGAGVENSTYDFTSFGLFALHLMCGGSALRNSINLINPATHTGIFNGGWNHTADEAIPDGSTGYMDSGVAPGTDFTSLSSLYFGCYNGSNNSNGQYGYMIGLQESGKFIGIYNQSLPDDLRFGTGNNIYQVLTDDFRIGNYSVNKVLAGTTQGVIHGVTNGSASDTMYSGYTLNIYVSCLNNGGTPQTFDGYGKKMCWYFSQGLTTPQLAMWDTIITAFLASMGCALGVFDVYGDSLAHDAYVLVPEERTIRRVAVLNNWIYRNYGISGTTIENVTPLNPIGFPNFYDAAQTTTSPTVYVRKYYPHLHKAILIGYSTNDILLNQGGYVDTTFGSQFLTAVDSVNSTRNWPYTKMVLFGATHLVYPDAADYFVLYYGATPQTTLQAQTRDALFRTAYQGVATTRSLIYVDSLTDTIGWNTGDGIHMTSGGCAIRAADIQAATVGLL